MTDCLNDEMRDHLPLLAHDALGAADATALRAHVAGCASCRAELELLEVTARVLDAGVPRVDTAAIVAALPAPRLRVVAAAPASRTPRRWARVPRQYVAAAASLLIVASLASPLLRGLFEAPVVDIGPDTTSAVEVRPSSGSPLTGGNGVVSAASPAAAAGIAPTTGLDELNEDDLTALLAELDLLEATVSREPVALRKPIVETPEGL